MSFGRNMRGFFRTCFSLNGLKTFLLGYVRPTVGLTIALWFYYHAIQPIVSSENNNLLMRWNRLKDVSLKINRTSSDSNRSPVPGNHVLWWFVSILFFEPLNVNSTLPEYEPSSAAMLDGTLRDVFVLIMYFSITFVMTWLAYYSLCSYKFRCSRPSHDSLVTPAKFDKKSGSFNSFMDTMARYFDAKPKLDDRQRCESLRSRLDIEANVFVDNFFLSSRSDSLNYNALCDVLRTFYGTSDSVDAVSQQYAFAQLLQKSNESPYQYFATLNKLGHNAYPRLSAYDRDDIIANRYMRGLIDDGLRQALLADYNADSHIKSNMYLQTKKYEGLTRTQRVGTYLPSPCPCVAAQKVVTDARIKINCSICHPITSRVPDSAASNKVVCNALSLQEQRCCYICHLPGHLRRHCPIGRDRRVMTMNTRMQSAYASSQGSCDQLNGLQRLRGYCKVNGVYSDFLADTGAERTVIHEQLIPKEHRSAIMPTGLTLLVASGIEAVLSGELDCNIQLGDTITACRVLVTRELNVNCLLGMDVLTKCPLTKGPLKALYDAVTSDLQAEVIDVSSLSNDKDKSLQSACYRTQVLTPGELSNVLKDSRVLTSKGRPHSEWYDHNEDETAPETYDLTDAELPPKVLHDVFQVVNSSDLPEPILQD